MKPTLDQKKTQLPSYRIDPALDKYNDVILFPEKVAKAKESIRKHGLPGQEIIDEAMKDADEKRLLKNANLHI